MPGRLAGDGRERVAAEVRIGLISDTHGLLREEAKSALSGSDIILHAGDVGSPDVLEELRVIARVIAVRGNVDRGEWADELPMAVLVEVAGIKIFLIHDIKQMEIDPVAAGVQVIIYGHSHKPGEKEESGILYLNPGSAGKRRFKLPIGLAVIEIRGDGIRTRWISMEVDSQSL